MTENNDLYLEENEVPETSDELSFSDKIIGVFSSPTETFSKVAKFPPKLIDWLLPVLIMIIVAIFSLYLLTNNPTISSEMKEIQTSAIEKNLQEKIDSGDLTEAEAQKQMDVIYDSLDSSNALGIFPQAIGIVFATFIFFFIFSGIFLLLSKFILKGTGNYNSAMVAYGLSYYILIVQVLVLIVLSLSSEKLITGTNLSYLIDLDSSSFAGFILKKIDPFLIWFYFTLAVAYSKMFKSDNTSKYIIAVVSLWLGAGTLLFLLGKLVPALSFLSM